MAAARSALACSALCAAALALGACSKDVRESAATVLTLQRGSMTALRDTRGTGPFRVYPVPPDEMRRIVADALRSRVVAVFEAPLRGEVCAKERSTELSTEDTYSETWTSAVIVFVHPVPGDEGSSKVEFHAARKGPFHKGNVRWEAELPALLDDAVAHRGSRPIRPLK